MPQEKDPEQYAQDMIDAGRGHLLRPEERCLSEDLHEVSGDLRTYLLYLQEFAAAAAEFRARAELFQALLAKTLSWARDREPK